MNELLVRPILAAIGAAVAGLALLSSGHALAAHQPIYGAVCTQGPLRTHTIRLVSDEGGCYDIAW